VRISDLSHTTGVPIPTVKYYLREGLLPPGERTSPNQARYDERHVQRLRLVRALIEVGGLSVAATKDVLAAVDDEQLPLFELTRVAHRAVTPRPTHDDDPGWRAARSEVARWIAGLGWHVRGDSPGLDQLADVLHALHRLGQDCDAPAAFAPYAALAQPIAEAELATVPTEPRDEAVLSVVVGTVLYESSLAALRRLAQEDASWHRFGVGAAGH